MPFNLEGGDGVPGGVFGIAPFSFVVFRTKSEMAGGGRERGEEGSSERRNRRTLSVGLSY